MIRFARSEYMRLLFGGRLEHDEVDHRPPMPHHGWHRDRHGAGLIGVEPRMRLDLDRERRHRLSGRSGSDRCNIPCRSCERQDDAPPHRAPLRNLPRTRGRRLSSLREAHRRRDSTARCLPGPLRKTGYSARVARGSRQPGVPVLRPSRGLQVLSGADASSGSRALYLTNGMLRRLSVTVGLVNCRGSTPAASPAPPGVPASRGGASPSGSASACRFPA